VVFMLRTIRGPILGRVVERAGPAKEPTRLAGDDFNLSRMSPVFNRPAYNIIVIVLVWCFCLCMCGLLEFGVSDYTLSAASFRFDPPHLLAVPC